MSGFDMLPLPVLNPVGDIADYDKTAEGAGTLHLHEEVLFDRTDFEEPGWHWGPCFLWEAQA